MNPINECTFEIRYKANAKVLDFRGTWAERISEHMNLTEWRIVENRIDLFDKEGASHGFVGFHNAGMRICDAPTKSSFYDAAIKLYTFISKLDGFAEKPYVERLGVRLRFCTAVTLSYEELTSKYLENYFSVGKRARDAIGGELLGVAGALNFKDSIGNFNTASGPLERKKIQDYFKSHPENKLPDLGLYYDIDYWVLPKKEVKTNDVCSTIRTFATTAWERHESLKKIILGE